jgi:hypothetical protein
MDFQTFQAELRRIGGAVHSFAAIGAALRLYQAKQKADPAVEARLLAAVEAVLPDTLDGLNPQQISDALAYVTFQIGEATELFRNADRPPGGFFRSPPYFRPWAKPLARTAVVLSRSPLTVQGWLRRSPAAFSMSARVSEP